MYITIDTINTSDATDTSEAGEGFELRLATTASARELWDRWEYLAELTTKVGNEMTETVQRWRNATDSVAKDRIWDEYETQARTFRVVVSWKDVFYAAFIFSTDGADCAALDDNPPPY